MKNLKVIIVLFTLGLFTTNLNAQLHVGAKGSIHVIGDFEFTYDAFGINVEGAFGDNFSIGMSADYGKHEQVRFLSFNPNIKWYTSESFHGFYAGIGLQYFKAKATGESNLIYPLPKSSTEISFFIPELKIGASALIDDMFVFQFEVHAGKSMDLDEMHYGGQFSIGVFLY